MKKIYSEHFDYSTTKDTPHDYQVKFTKFFKVQLKKNASSKNKEYSLYSPSLFYGDDKQLIRHSLSSLIKTPQNNLKFVMNGIDVLKNTEYLQNITEAPVVTKYCDMVTEIVHESGIIETLRNLQAMFDSNVQMITRTLKELKQLFDELIVSTSESSLKQIAEDAIKIILENIGTKQEHKILLTQPKLSSYLEIVLRFLLSITFRDCSILISIHRIRSSLLEFPKVRKFLETNGFKLYKADSKEDKMLFYKLGLVDTDMKPLKHLITYPKLDKELLDIYVDHIMATFSAI